MTGTGASSPAPSWPARLFGLAIRLVIRRRSWGAGPALARRARRLFGAPPVYRSLAALGTRREPVRTPRVRGEWLRPADPLPGTILYLHGGGFVSGSPATHRPIAAALARRTQRRVLSVEYRLAPENPFPHALEDVLAAYEWLRGEGESPSSIAVAGDSAGGNLVLRLAIEVRNRGGSLPACLVMFSPWTDLAGTGPSARTNDGPDPMFRYENLADFAEPYLQGNVAADDPGASPVYDDLSGLSPMLLHVGSTEILLDDARRVHARVQKAGGDSTLTVFAGVPHCWQMLTPWVPEARESLAQAAAFITRRLQSDR